MTCANRLKFFPVFIVKRCRCVVPPSRCCNPPDLGDGWCYSLSQSGPLVARTGATTRLKNQQTGQIRESIESFDYTELSSGI